MTTSARLRLVTEPGSERDAQGRLQLWIHATASRVLLRKFADAVALDYGADGRDRVEGMGQVFWDFVAGPVAFTLHLDHAKGIAVFANDTSAVSEAFVRSMAARLRMLRADG